MEAVSAAQKDNQPDWRLRQFRWQLFTATWLSYAGFYFTRKVFTSLKKDIAVGLQVDAQGVAHLYTVYLVTYALGQFVAAWLSKRMNNRSQLILGMAVSIACCLAMGKFVQMGSAGYPFFLVTMGIHGLAQAAGWPNNVALMANWTRRAERGSIMAVWGTCYQIGSIAAKSFAGYMFVLAGLLGAHWAASFVLLVVLGVFLFWGKQSPASVGLTPIVDDDTPAQDGSGKSSAVKKSGESSLSRRQILLIASMGAIYFTIKSVRYALESWGPYIVKEHFHRSTEFAANASTTFDWLGFFGVLAAGWISDRWFRSARSPVIFLMTCGLFVGSIALWWVGLSSLALFIVLIGVVGFMDMGPDSLLVGAGAVEAGNQRQAVVAVGIINGLGSIGPIVQEEVIAWLQVRQGLGAVCLLLVGFSAVATVATGLLFASSRRYRLGL
ncbi:MAG: MFS transporter [Deltaproteobacteria bacterium]|nr:MFS transporter [Deltaproteobacteria bacterium]